MFEYQWHLYIEDLVAMVGVSVAVNMQKYSMYAVF